MFAFFKAVAYVRNSMGFQGLLMTDDLSDTSLNKVYSQDQAAIEAVKAGMNMILFQQDLKAAIMQYSQQ